MNTIHAANLLIFFAVSTAEWCLCLRVSKSSSFWHQIHPKYKSGIQIATESIHGHYGQRLPRFTILISDFEIRAGGRINS